MTENPTISIIGLGYVGLPLAVHLAKHYKVTGFDINQSRINELREGVDRTGEIEISDLRNSTLHLTSDKAELSGHNVHIVTVPTPVDKKNTPDLTPVKKASETVSSFLKKGDIVVYESTVYPGVTEDICGPILASGSGLECGKDFFLGYSPERINPGDKEHTVDNITKVVAGQTPEVAQVLQSIYGTMNGDRIFLAKNIKTAEAAKVIENAQRDINIAFVNEIAIIFQKLGISVYDVLEAAGTKWNFLNFKPGLVGGHCIGVDPYYLTHKAKKTGYHAKVINSGRYVNDSMGFYIGKQTVKKILQFCKQFLKQAFDFVDEGIKCYNAVLVGIYNGTVEILAGIIEGIGQLISLLNPDNVKAIVDGVSKIFENGFWNGISTLIQKAIKGLFNFIDDDHIYKNAYEFGLFIPKIIEIVLDAIFAYKGAVKLASKVVDFTKSAVQKAKLVRRRIDDALLTIVEYSEAFLKAFKP